jgi:hypothetical protein
MTNNKTTKAPKGFRRLLGTANYKTSKGESLGYLTGILYLSPANESGVMNTCLFASKECIAGCLKSSGRMPMGVKSRIWKTQLLHANRTQFLEFLRYDIGRLIRRARKLGLTPAVRLNGTSDLPWLSLQMSNEFPDVQFYDYTKLPKPYLRTRPNYAITFSYSGHNIAETMGALAHCVNVAVVFDTRKGQPLPEFWNGYRVVDGDMHDLRFLDARGVVVGLRAKGKARNQDSAFIVKSDLIQLALAA